MACLAKMKEFLSVRVAGDSAEQQFPPIVKAYLTSILQPAAGDKLGQRSGQELANLAEALDALIQGDVPRALDVLTMRFQAVETAASSGNKWEVARHLQLAGDTRVSCVDDRVLAMATSAERRDQKLRNSL